MTPMQRPQSQRNLACRVMASAALFWVGSLLSPNAMGASIYGDLAFAFEVEAWVSGFILGAALLAYGVTINGAWRYSPLLRIAGLSILLVLFSALAWSAFQAPSGVIIWSWSIPCLLLPCANFLRLNVVDVSRRWRNDRN